ncbi:hypothetical protein NIES2135_61070 (plasmid) [Leptolyngbya boryana NIES-2135]|jgi:vacuolar-type H+-ATPase subunit I/STV1|uniref:Uncharacterized protein n=1 Tax=Leptolyngbya boryana NIES-2135 TaxID=1973484 RepID=A0A1Z4JR93_LEPBY|nr:MULTISPECIES: hypothetical protein [Leptolyngbya]BAY59230.1 hypothetical protein NIES2135_61070 [Leptolyngbya boryana NIES-2135]MBD2372819.1 hypothetical protein [Leptolyngbya sp. FACHB-238]MBD2397429.1 hypothetical protein [Leptolyngbya sp. FACHB-239]MBD2403766.1 hypothetical protein [Leptolyngbya sp. FACHB-402]ULP33422.1 hypothetical protein MCP04_30290 [Leptolyngbya boryana IU 594]
MPENSNPLSDLENEVAELSLALSQQTTSIGELKEVVGRLWKEVDASKIASQQDAVKIHDKIDQWIETNRLILESSQHLLKVIMVNSEETQKSGDSYRSVMKWGEEFSQRQSEYDKTMKQLGDTFSRLKSFHENLQATNEKLTKLNQKKSAGIFPIWRADSFVALGLCGALAIVICGCFLWVTPVLNRINNQLAASAARIQKLEQKQ